MSPSSPKRIGSNNLDWVSIGAGQKRSAVSFIDPERVVLIKARFSR
jgi:hypothetical protein